MLFALQSIKWQTSSADFVGDIIDFYKNQFMLRQQQFIGYHIKQ